MATLVGTVMQSIRIPWQCDPAADRIPAAESRTCETLVVARTENQIPSVFQAQTEQAVRHAAPRIRMVYGLRCGIHWARVAPPADVRRCRSRVPFPVTGVAANDGFRPDRATCSEVWPCGTCARREGPSGRIKRGSQAGKALWCGYANDVSFQLFFELLLTEFRQYGILCAESIGNMVGYRTVAG